MGVICVKRDSNGSSFNRSDLSQSRFSDIQTKMDKTEYKRLRMVRQLMEEPNAQKSESLPLKIDGNRNDRSVTDFKFIRHLGDGTYGEVALVKDKKTGEEYAMKIIKKDMVIEREEILNALSERYILAAMDHPFVVKLHYAFQTKHKIYLIVDLMAGGELFYLLRRNKRFSEDEAKFYAAQIILALEYLHSKQIIYRDLKPENILLDRDGHIKLTDFGLSKVVFKRNEVTTSICGTPQYIAPEVLKGKGYTMVADWFSFGSLLYDMLTGRPPFYSKDKQEMMKKIQTKDIPFPDFLSPDAKSFLKAVFQKKENNRLGYKKGAQEIKSHPFFKDIDFGQILKKSVSPPFQFNEDINNQGFAVKFDQYELEESYERELQESSKGVNFQGFTYQKKHSKHETENLNEMDIMEHQSESNEQRLKDSRESPVIKEERESEGISEGKTNSSNSAGKVERVSAIKLIRLQNRSEEGEALNSHPSSEREEKQGDSHPMSFGRDQKGE